MARQKGIQLDGWFHHNVDMNNRLLYMGSIETPHDQEVGVDFKMAEAVIKGLIALDAADPKGKSPITIVMNNPGGSVIHGLAIYDAIKSCKNPVTIMVYGYAMSMGAVILQAADVRVMAPNSALMIHYGEVGISEHPKNAKNWLRFNDRLGTKIEEILLAKMQKKNRRIKKRDVKKLLDFDTYLSAEDAVDLGLADAVLKTGI